MTTTLFVMLNTMSAQAGITERTWLVTCLGFTIVLVLLLLFVFGMAHATPAKSRCGRTC